MMRSRQSGHVVLKVIALVVFLTIAVSSLMPLTEISASRRNSMRLKSIQASLESAVITKTNQPYAYKNCGSQDMSRCEVDLSFFADVQKVAIPATEEVQCPDGVCGFYLKGPKTGPGIYAAEPVLDKSTIPFRFRATILYTGKAPVLAPTEINEEISTDILQSVSMNCAMLNSQKPFFSGFGSDGEPLCEGVEPCAPGTFASALDLNTRRLECRPLAGVARCGPEKMLTDFAWNGRSIAQVECSDKPIPSLAFNAKENPVEPPGNPRNGRCGPSHGQNFSAKPTSGLCSRGNASNVSGGGPWTWKCRGSDGGSDASCSADREANPTNGACGSSHGGVFSAAPNRNLCSIGNPSPVSGSGPWTWNCLGFNGGSDASCRARRQNDNERTNGVCGAADGAEFLRAPTQNLCRSGTATSVLGDGPWVWRCMGENGGNNDTCRARRIQEEEENGVCGSAHGSTMSSRPTSNLCAEGRPSGVTGDGPWKWTCSGRNGGADARCRADTNMERARCGEMNCAVIASRGATRGLESSYCPVPGSRPTGVRFIWRATGRDGFNTGGLYWKCTSPAGDSPTCGGSLDPNSFFACGIGTGEGGGD